METPNASAVMRDAQTGRRLSSREPRAVVEVLPALRRVEAEVARGAYHVYERVDVRKRAVVSMTSRSHSSPAKVWPEPRIIRSSTEPRPESASS